MQQIKARNFKKQQFQTRAVPRSDASNRWGLLSLSQQRARKEPVSGPVRLLLLVLLALEIFALPSQLLAFLPDLWIGLGSSRLERQTPPGALHLSCSRKRRQVRSL